jgi:hypothetical protein
VDWNTSTPAAVAGEWLGKGVLAGSDAGLVQSIFGIHVDFLSALKGGFFLRKKPLSIVPSVYTNSENAITPLTHAEQV